MDIQLRFHKDNLVIGSPVVCGLQRLGLQLVDDEGSINHGDLVSANILEKESLRAAYGPDSIAGVHCLVANTYDVLPSRLQGICCDTSANLEDKIGELADSALRIVCDTKPQHVLVELGPSLLEFDGESRESCVAVRDDYVEAGRIFEAIDRRGASTFDAYMLSDISDVDELKCALMGLRQVSDKPVFTRVHVDSEGCLDDKHNIYDYVQVAVEFGASVAGIVCMGATDCCTKLVKRMRAGCDLPLMIEFEVSGSQDSAFFVPGNLKEAVTNCCKAGAQFFRVSGEVKPSHTAVLMATTMIL